MKVELTTLLFLVMTVATPGCVQNSEDRVNLIDFRDRQSIERHKPVLIAHRGGVITERTPECSLAAMRLAKQQGYAMVEFNRVQKGDTVDLSGKYWFGLPHRIPDDTVKRLRQNGAYVIVAINTFRYPQYNHYELARKDIDRLTRAGVEGFQIDSVYKPLFDDD